MTLYASKDFENHLNVTMTFSSANGNEENAHGRFN